MLFRQSFVLFCWLSSLKSSMVVRFEHLRVLFLLMVVFRFSIWELVIFVFRLRISIKQIPGSFVHRRAFVGNVIPSIWKRTFLTINLLMFVFYFKRVVQVFLVYCFPLTECLTELKILFFQQGGMLALAYLTLVLFTCHERSFRTGLDTPKKMRRRYLLIREFLVMFF